MATDEPLRRRDKAARHKNLMSLLQQGVSQVEELSEQLNVSPSTVRRDLGQLTNEGHVARTYGGAIARSAFRERSISESADLRRVAKRAIAGAAADLIPDRSTVFLDAGTTCLALADRLRGHDGLTVVTRGLEAAMTLASFPDLQVMVLGGLVRPLSHGLVGPLTNLALDRLSFDVAFLGADAVDVRGIGEPTLYETLVKEVVARSSDRVFVLADSTKLAGESPHAWTELPAGWSLITDGEVTEDVVSRFSSRDIDVIVAVPFDQVGSDVPVTTDEAAGNARS